MSDPLFQVEDQGGNTVIIRNVPVFQEHTDREYLCDRTWLDRCVADFLAQKAESAEVGGDRYAMLPPITLGHTPDDPNQPEPPAKGFVDNLRRVGKWLFCDFVDVARDAYERMKAGEFPFRSAEIIPKRHRLTNVSLLGGRYPHFALPVMKFRAMFGGEECDVVRYTLRGMPMANNDKIDRSWDQQNGQGGGGGNGQGMQNNQGGGGGSMGISPQALQQIAQAVAPIVAKMVAENQANAMGGPMANAGAYKDDQGKTYYKDDEGKAFYIREGKIVYAETDTDGKPKVQAGHGKSEEELSDTERTPHMDKESTSGEEKNAALAAEVKKYLAPYEQRINSLVDENKTLKGQVGELLQHNKANVEASKRTMLRAKLGEIAALGYAIGDKERIEKHVNLMLKMSTEDVTDYIENTLKQFPKVKTTVERHGTSEGIRRPGSEDDNERYYLENKEDLDKMGIDKSVLELSDALGGI